MSGVIAANHIIGKIDIQTGNLFDIGRSGQRRKVHRLSNSLHIKTLENTVRSALTVRAGDSFSADKLAESERALREKRYIRDASVKAVQICDGGLTIQVRTIDNWTLTPSISFGRAGGVNKYTIELQDLNFFGTGKEIKLRERRTSGLHESSFTYGDDNVFGGRHKIRLDIGRNNDGAVYDLQAGLPFFTSESQFSWWLRSSSKTLSFDDKNVPKHTVSVLSELIDVRAERRSDISKNRYFSLGAGLRFAYQKSSPQDESPTFQNTNDFKDNYPFLTVSWKQHQWIKKQNFENIRTNEDIDLGYSIKTEAGFIFGGVGDSSKNTLRLNFSLENNWQIGSNAFHRINIDHTQFLYRTKKKNATRLHYGYFNWVTPNDQFKIRLIAERIDGYSPIHNKKIGGENGLKAYPNRFQDGENRAIGLVEYRHITGWSPYSLVNTGFSLFLEAGSAWNSDKDATVLSNVGVGVLIAPSRSSRAAINRFEIAMPLANVENVGKYQIFIGTKINY